MADIRKLRKALRAIEKNPEHHDQGSWCRIPEGDFTAHSRDRRIDVSASNGKIPPCGTTLCMAGWLAFQGGPKGARLDYAYITGADGTISFISDWARDYAGLTAEQAETMFHCAS